MTKLLLCMMLMRMRVLVEYKYECRDFPEHKSVSVSHRYEKSAYERG
jgi:hypothetical protein